MATLDWETKSDIDPTPVRLVLDTCVYPQSLPGPTGEHCVEDRGNRLIWGDNLEVMSALLPEYEGALDLIYVDPPFFTNRRYPARIGRGEDSRRPQEWLLAEGYPDHWKDIDAYLDMLYPRLILMHRLLSEKGTLYLHLDWHANSYARVLLDEIFGADRMLNEIVWVYHGPSPIRSAFNRKHDTILVYTKSDEYTFNVDDVRVPYNPSTVKTFASSSKAGFGKVPNLKRGKVPEDWWYFPVVARLHSERTGYPTQKPEALLERIILASSDPDDLVADFFCGSGTTAKVAVKHGRRFIANDGKWRAVQTTYARLLESQAAPFTLQRVERLPEVCADWDIELIEAGDKLTIPGDLLNELEYWEIDPTWSGEHFHSELQAVRPKRNGELEHRLPLAIHPQPAQNRICIRALTTDGHRLQKLLTG
jgi:DNA modification methylase